jgi:hypothetical protein
MVGLLLDAAVLVGIMQVLTDDPPSFLKAIFVALAISVGFFLCAILLAPTIGILFLLPMLLVGPLVLWITCDLPPKQAVIAGGILLAYKVTITLLFAWLLS